MENIIFGFTIASEMLLVSSLICTLAISGFRAWPPPRQNSWQFYYNWTLFIIAFLGIFLLGIWDWNSFLINHWLKIPLGVTLVMSGLVLAFWGVITISVNDSLGLEGELRTDGLYKYSRNPQYLGDLVLFLGYSLLTNSWMVIITSIGLAAWFLLAPFTEEPWLKEHYGEEYEKYIERVPRFI